MVHNIYNPLLFFDIISVFHFLNCENLANLGGLNLRPRLSLKQSYPEDQDEEECRPWRKKFTLSNMAFKFSWVSFSRLTLLLTLVIAIVVACYTLPVEKVRFCSLGP